MRTQLAFFFTIWATLLMGQVFTELSSLELEGVRSGSSEMVDVNGDGLLDIFVIGTNSSTAPVANLYINDGDGLFTVSEESEIVGLDRGHITTGDVDNDGDMDVIAAGIPSNFSRMCRLYKNDGNGGFPLPAEDGFKAIQDCKLTLADIDNDQDLDLLATGKKSNGDRMLELYVNDGDGVFQDTSTANFTLVSNGRQVFTDVDGDGDNDLIISGNTSTFNRTILYLNDGQGVYTATSGEAPFMNNYYHSVEVGDVDGDGDEDLFIADTDDTKLYMNDGSGNFTEALDTPFDRMRLGYATLGDIDGDGDIDIMTCGENQDSVIAKIYINDGNANFEELLGTSFTATTKGAISMGDIDNDGDLDVLIVGETKDNKVIAKVYRNELISSDLEIGKNDGCRLSISPNPITNGILNATNECDNGRPMTVSVLSTAGEIIIKNLPIQNQSNSSFQVDIANLNPGLYLLQSSSDSGISIQRFMVSK